MPCLVTGRRYQSCCGKMICSGCIFAPVYDDLGNVITEETCPFCRTSAPTCEKEAIERLIGRVEGEDANAIYNLGVYHAEGSYGFSHDIAKSLELWHRTGKLGHATAYYNIGSMYYNGNGVEVDEKKAKHYYELAAMQGHVKARHMLGTIDGQAGNMDRALRHYMIAVSGGGKESLDTIRKMLSFGHATKDDYKKALRAYQSYLAEIKSDQRDEAAAADYKYKYIE